MRTTTNTPTHPGAPTPAEKRRRNLDRLTNAAAALAITAATIAFFAVLFFVF